MPDCTADEACDNSEFESDHCQCEKIRGQMSIKCGLPLVQFRNTNGKLEKEGKEDITGRVQGAGRAKRDIIYSDDIIYLYDDGEPKKRIYNNYRGRRAVNAKMSLENATEYCRNAILNTATAKVCLEISGVNASNAIESCAADLQVRRVHVLSRGVLNLYLKFCFYFDMNKNTVSVINEA